MKIRDENMEQWVLQTKEGEKKLEVVNTFKYLGVEISNGRNIYKEQKKAALVKLTRNKGISKLKAKESFDRVDVAEALWEYICINGSL